MFYQAYRSICYVMQNWNGLPLNVSAAHNTSEVMWIHILLNTSRPLPHYDQRSKGHSSLWSVTGDITQKGYEKKRTKLLVPYFIHTPGKEPSPLFWGGGLNDLVSPQISLKPDCIFLYSFFIIDLFSPQCLFISCQFTKKGCKILHCRISEGNIT